MRRILFVIANALLVAANFLAYLGMEAEAALLIAFSCLLFILVAR